jgi:hypothetical protein
MYAYTTGDKPRREVDFKDQSLVELHYWRKHPNLHGWMTELYFAKGGRDKKFNCVNLLLTPADIDQLEIAIRQEKLPYTTGFFFGESDGSEVADDLAFIAKAREAMAQELFVFYTAWW